MKNILLVLTVILVSSFTSTIDNKVVELEVTYNGQSDKAYYFTNKETEKVMEFTFVSKKAVSKYDLNEKKYVGKTFLITYEIDPIEVINKDSKKEVEVKQYKQRLILLDIKETENAPVKN